jgi:hypothetical protein
VLLSRGAYNGLPCAVKLIYTSDLTEEVISRVTTEASILSAASVCSSPLLSFPCLLIPSLECQYREDFGDSCAPSKVTTFSLSLQISLPLSSDWSIACLVVLVGDSVCVWSWSCVPMDHCLMS